MNIGLAIPSAVYIFIRNNAAAHHNRHQNTITVIEK